MTFMLCPICREKVNGRSEIDLGEQVREHWSEAHDLRVRARESLPRSWGGRR